MEKTFDFEKTGKRMPYTVPDGFFDKMEENVMKEVRGLKEDSKAAAKFSILHSPFSIKKAFLAMAAAIALFFIVQPLFTKNDPADFESVELAFNNLSTDDQEYLIQVYDDNEYLQNW